MSRKITRFLPPVPPAPDQLPLVNASPVVALWLDHYWRKLNLPVAQTKRLAVTDNRAEFARWTGRRLNPMALGCYCYLPLSDNADAVASELAASSNLRAPASESARLQPTLPGFAGYDDAEPGRETTTLDTPPTTPTPAALSAPERPPDYRHLIFIEPDLLVEGIEVTVAHELIHLADRVAGAPRKHHCHGHDSISQDEAALTARDPKWLRDLLAEETQRREGVLRQARPYRYLYVCLNCGKEYPRVKRYSRAVSCGHCDQRFNAAFLLHLRPFGGATAPAPDDWSAQSSLAGRVMSSRSSNSKRS